MADCAKCAKSLKNVKVCMKINFVDYSQAFHARYVNISADGVHYLIEQDDVTNVLRCDERAPGIEDADDVNYLIEQDDVTNVLRCDERVPGIEECDERAPGIEISVSYDVPCQYVTTVQMRDYLIEQDDVTNVLRCDERDLESRSSVSSTFHAKYVTTSADDVNYLIEQDDVTNVLRCDERAPGIEE
ncbi:hypothetical protein J6590_080615 [Homalodisca vitripennis]|nr:hypothetical protein J6590_080615 [Homalodisca vitripennis]